MIRFLILCIVFFLLYLGFNIASAYDKNIKILFLDYQIETTFFLFSSLFFVLQFVLMIGFKVIFTIFDLPRILRRKLEKRRLMQINKKLINSLAELLMGNNKKSIKLLHSVVPELDNENKEVADLISAEIDNGFDKKVQYYRNLLDKKNFNIYASKKLAEIFYTNSHHLQAEEFALRAFNEDDNDPQLMLLLIRIYANIGLWNKLIFVVSKLQRTNPKLFAENNSEIASYYYNAAKYYLQNGSDEEAIQYIEVALEFKPDHIDSLSLFTELMNNSSNSALILKVLKGAFSVNPCFEIARMYVDSSKSSPEAIYGTLAGIVQPAKHLALYLALSAYLGLTNKASELREPKLIAYEKGSK